MSTLDSRDQSIITQVAAKIASDLTVAAGGDVRIEDLLGDFAVALPTVRDALFDAVNAAIAESTFAGSTNVTPIQAAPSYQPQPPAEPVYQPVAAPAPIPGATDGDPATAALWVELQQNPGDWYDNRTSKKNPRGPDFKNRRDGDKALWVVGKNNPSWVPQLVANLRF